MPEYLAPGVYVEETSFRARSIQGVGTSTTGFVGLARKGPTDGLPELVTSFGEFERMFGGLDDLNLSGANIDATSYMAYAARAFFNEGGSRLYVARVFLDRPGAQAGGQAQSAEAALGASRFRSRHPGSAYDGTVRVTERTAPASARALETAPLGSLARVGECGQSRWLPRPRGRPAGGPTRAPTRTRRGRRPTMSPRRSSSTRRPTR